MKGEPSAPASIAPCVVLISPLPCSSPFPPAQHLPSFKPSTCPQLQINMRSSQLLRSIALAATAFCLATVKAEEQSTTQAASSSYQAEAIIAPITSSLRGATLNTISAEDAATIIAAPVGEAVVGGKVTPDNDATVMEQASMTPASTEGDKSWDNLFTDQGNPAFIQYSGTNWISVSSHE